MPEFVGDDDAADRDGCRGDGNHVGDARPAGRAIRNHRGHVDALQNPVAILVLLAEGKQAEHTHERVFGRLLVLGLNADVIDGPRRHVAINEHVCTTTAECLVGCCQDQRVQMSQAGIGGNVEVDVRLGPGGIVQVGLVQAEARQ